MTADNKSSVIPSVVNHLNLYLDDLNIIRSKGRLDRCEMFDSSVRNPVLLSKRSYLTELIVWEAHERCLHLGTASTLNCVRKGGYWIPQGRNTIKYIIAKCISCQKINSHAFKYPKMTNYIADKVNFVRPYLYTGIDFTGHIFVKLGDKIVKMYLLVFTCLNVRAIHLELLPSMSCLDFLLALTRFSNMYGIPDAIYSDNASTFIQAMNFLSKSLLTMILPPTF